MARYIDADKMEKHFIEKVSKHNLTTNNNGHPVFLVDHTLREIRNFPTADVVEVVRCKDCSVPHNKWTGCPNLNGLIPPPDFYCAKGEKIMPNVNLVDGHVDEAKDYPPYLDVPKKPVYRTNYDRIRNMSVEEMINIIIRNDNCEKFCACTKDGKCINYGGAENCIIGVKGWLESEVDTE